MSRNKRPRKAYRPRSTAGAFVMAAQLMARADSSATEPAAKDKVDTLMLTFWSAIDSVARLQHPGREDWRQISDAINHVETLVLQGYLDHEATSPLVEAAVAGMVKAANRWQADQGMRMDAAGLNAVRDVIGLYEQAMRELPEIVIVTAQIQTQQRLAQILASKPVVDRKVVII